MSQQESKAYESWAILEVFGHTTLAGFVSEETIAGGPLLRIDVPEVGDQPPFTKYYGQSAIYSLLPTTEAHAREAAAQIRVRPVTLYILPEPKRLAQVADIDPDAEYERYGGGYDDDDDFEGDDDEVDDEVVEQTSDENGMPF